MPVSIGKMVVNEPILKNWPLKPYMYSCPQDTLGQILYFKIGVTIFYAGDPASWVYWILKGDLQCGMSSMLSVAHSFYTSHPGGAIGEYEVVGRLDAYLADVVTVGDVVVLRMSAVDYLRWLSVDSHLTLERFRLSTLDLLQQSVDSNLNRFMGSQKKLAMKLSRYFEIHRTQVHITNPQKTLRINYTHEELSKDIGINIRTVSRGLNELEAHSLITRFGGKIYISMHQINLMKMDLFDLENG